jgi:rhamnulose-1-phosphate aldolase
MRVYGLDHVQIAMPPGEEDKARAFYAGILGLIEIPKPPDLAQRGGAWFQSSALTLHLGVEQDFRPAKKAHPALLVEGLAELAARCQQAGYPISHDAPLEGYDRLHVFDPFGNRLELIEPVQSMNLDRLMALMGEAGQRLAQIEASEGAAGNLSIFIGWPIQPGEYFPLCEQSPLPVPAPELAGKAFLVTGSGCRLRDIQADPTGNLGLLVVSPGGQEGSLYTAPNRRFTRLTSEFNSHLAVHHDQVIRRELEFHALAHAQPVHLTFLSHIPEYQDAQFANQRLLRWQPETLLNLPEGIACLPFCIPGSSEMMAANAAALQNHRVALWSKHGMMARSDKSLMGAVDLIEYIETGARYEYMSLLTGNRAAGLTAQEMGATCAAYHVEQNLF